MLRLDRGQIIRFLRALDSALEGELQIFVVGGLAAIVKYNAAVKTSDMDVYAIVSGRDDDLTRAARVASDVTGIMLSIGGAPITELPWNYEDRLKRVMGLRFKNLTMIVPDKYDLTLSKAIRGYEHDLEAIASMHKHHRLSEKTLVNRYETEIRKIVGGDERNIALNMVQLVRLLYGKKSAEVYEKRWGLAKPR